jgi:RNA polymerase sigma factor (TIGR02999 family)
MTEVTHILSTLPDSDPHVACRLLPLVYEELRRLAAAQLAREEPHWDNRGHFFAAAAEAMRRILIDNARRKHRPKHGGNRRRAVGDVTAPGPEMPLEDLLALDEALDKLARKEPARAELVKLRFFAGLTMAEVAEALGISLATAERHWNYARTWLYAELKEAAEGPNG